MKCSVRSCSVHDMGSLAIIDDGDKRFVLCRDHQISYALSALDEQELNVYSSQLEETECEICASPAYIYADEVELHLCRRHLFKLIRKDLNPLEYQILHENHMEFEWLVEEYYSKGGYALQPIR